MNKNIILIQSHCNNEEKKNVLMENIKKLRNHNFDILLFSHIPLSEDIISEVDYFIFCDENPIMWEERRHYYWNISKNIKYETIVPDYGWTVFNQIIKSFNFVRNSRYEHVYLFCYDLLIDQVIEDFLTNPRRGIFKHKKPDTILEGVALVFSVFEKEKFEKIVDSLDRDEYSKNWNWIAEKYFEEKLKSLDLYEKPILHVKDLLHESKDVFNMSQNESYFLFLDTKNLLKFRFINNSDQKIKILINDKVFDRENGEFVFMEEINEIETLGCIVEDNFDNWIPILESKRTNTISSL